MSESARSDLHPRHQHVNRLVRRARNGDSGAWDQLYFEFRDAGLAFCRSVLKDADLAEDVFQESFLEATAALPRLREDAAFAVWFRRILIKQCDRARRGRANREFSDNQSLLPANELFTDELPEDLLADQELRERVRSALDQLPALERELCIEYYFEERDQNEISRRHGIPLHTIKNRLHNARRLLRRTLAPYSLSGSGGAFMMAA